MSAGQRGEGTYPSDSRLREIWLAPKLAWLRSEKHLSRNVALLDYGCGPGDFVGLIADEVGRADGFDIDPAAVSTAEKRFGGRSRFFADPEQLASSKYDIITVTSVLQYIDHEELPHFCRRMRGLLKDDPHAFVLISDIIPPEYKSVPDALNSVLVGIRSGAAMAMTGHLFRSVVRMQKSALTSWEPATLRNVADAAGFELTVLPGNLTPSRQRYSCVLRLKA